MTRLRTIIVDDDEIARIAVRKCVEKTDFLSLEGCYSNVPDALTAIRDKNVDLIFLDVELPEMSGIDFLKTFKDIPQIVLVTGKKEYAAEAFDYDVTDFLLKPIDYARFLKAAMKARNVAETMEVKNEENQDLIFIKKEGARLVRLPASEILYVEALADYVNIYTTEGRHTLLSTMKAIESKLPAKDFMRIHRSFIVRLDKITEIEENSVNIHGKAIPVSRSHKDDLFSRLKLL
ncbi:MAG: LytTR family DNA-binding domain-containing protein [Bacteroidia bacterium]